MVRCFDGSGTRRSRLVGLFRHIAHSTLTGLGGRGSHAHELTIRFPDLDDDS